MKYWLAGLLLCASISTTMAEIYRIEKPDGSVEYTDQKPADGTAKTEEIELQEIENSNDMRSITRGYDRIIKESERAQAKIDKKVKLRQKTLAPFRKKLLEAEAALSEGKQKREGDYISNANGGTRLSPSYLSRVASLEAAVDSAKTELQKALYN